MERTRALFVNSGMDFKYVVQGYDPDYLGWLDDRFEALGEGDIARVMSEVMDDERWGPRNPRASTWDLFDAELDLWLAQVHQGHPIELVVKDVRIGPRHDSAWHLWSARKACATGAAVGTAGTGPSIDLLPALHQLLGSMDPMHPWADLVAPLLRQLVRAVPPQQWSEEQRGVSTDLLRLYGCGRADVMAAVIASYPARERTARAADLLRDHHPHALALFMETKTYKLLLNDELFALASREAPACALPSGWWVQSVPERLKLNDREAGAGLPPIADPLREWARRMFVIAEANGTLEAEAGQEQNKYGYARRALREWKELRATLSLEG